MSFINPYSASTFSQKSLGSKAVDVQKNILQTSSIENNQDKVNISYSGNTPKDMPLTNKTLVYSKKQATPPLSDAQLHRRELESAKTRDEVTDIKNQKVKYFLDEMDKINNSDFSFEKKQELSDKLSKWLIAISEENDSFNKSGKLAALDAKEKFDFAKDLEKQNAAKMKELQAQLESADESAKAAAKDADAKMKCLLIAGRIMAGDDVPKKDHKFLMDNEPKLYSTAITFRMENDDPKKYKRLSEDEEEDNKVDSSSDNSSAISSDNSSESVSVEGSPDLAVSSESPQ